MKSQWKGSNLENGRWCYHAGDPTGLLWSVEWQTHGTTGWRVTAQRTAWGSCAFGPATWFPQKSPPLVALPSVHGCVCMIGYTGRLIQVWSVALSQCRGRNSSNSMYDKSMLGCIIRCRCYQMWASLKHNPWFFRLFFSVLITALLRSVIYHSQGFQGCQTTVFQLLLFCCSQSLRCFDQHLQWVWGKAELFTPFQTA